MAGDLTYPSYLKVDELLSLQDCLSQEHDELQFIIVHQASELWFKLVLFELESARTQIFAGDAAAAARLIRRVHAILRVFIGHFDVIETMQPRDFLRFRQRLEPASGFQSVQFREIEIISGGGDPRYVSLYGRQPGAEERLRRRLAEPTLWDAYTRHLQDTGYDVATEEGLRATLLQIAGTGGTSPLSDLTEGLLEYDEIVSMWRARHLKMTERIIGARSGTGKASLDELVKTGYSVMGSGGVDYLRTTLEKRFFPLLWEARTRLML